MALCIRGEALDHRRGVGGEALRVLLDARAVERSAVDEEHLGRREHAAERLRLEPKSPLIHAGDDAQLHGDTFHTVTGPPTLFTVAALATSRRLCSLARAHTLHHLYPRLST